MSDNYEPWDNSYVLDGETEILLRKLLVSSLSDEQVVRSCIERVRSLLSPDDEAKLKAGMSSGALGLLGLDLQPFSGGVSEWMRMRERVQQGVDWTEVPAEEQELSKRRANYILKYATDNGWVARAADKGGWEITGLGRAKMEREGFNMR